MNGVPSDRNVAKFWKMDPRSGCRCKSDTIEFLTTDFLNVTSCGSRMINIFRKYRAEKNWSFIREFISKNVDHFKQLAEATRVRNKLLMNAE